MELSQGVVAASGSRTGRRARLLLFVVVAAAISFNIHSPVQQLNPNTIKTAGFTSNGWCANGQINISTLACGVQANEATTYFCHWLGDNDGDIAADGNGCREEFDANYWGDGNCFCDGDGDGDANQTDTCGPCTGWADMPGCCDANTIGGYVRNPPDGAGRDPDYFPDLSFTGDPGYENDWAGSYDAKSGGGLCCGSSASYEPSPYWQNEDYPYCPFGGGDADFVPDPLPIETSNCDNDAGTGDNAGNYEPWPGDGCNCNPDEDSDGDTWGSSDGDSHYDNHVPAHWEPSSDSCSGCDFDNDGDAISQNDPGWDYTIRPPDAGCPSSDYYGCSMLGQDSSHWIYSSLDAYYAGLEDVSYDSGGVTHHLYYYCFHPTQGQLTPGMDTEHYHYSQTAPGADNRIMYIAQFFGHDPGPTSSRFWPGSLPDAQAMWSAAAAAVWHFYFLDTGQGWQGSSFSGSGFPASVYSDANSYFTTIINDAQWAVNNGYAPYNGGSAYVDQYHLDVPSNAPGLPAGSIIAGGTSTVTWHSVYPTDNNGKFNDGVTLYITSQDNGSDAYFVGGTTCVTSWGTFPCIHVLTNGSGVATATLSAATPTPVGVPIHISAISDNGNWLNAGFWASNSSGTYQNMIEAGVNAHVDEQNGQGTALTVYPPANPNFTESLTSSSFGGTSCGNGAWSQTSASTTSVVALTCANPGDTLNWNMTYYNTGAGSTWVPGTITSCYGSAYDTVPIVNQTCGQFEDQLQSPAGSGGTCAVTFPPSPGTATWCTSILLPGTQASANMTATVPPTWDDVGNSNQRIQCNFPYYRYVYTNNGVLPGFMAVDQEACAATTYATNIGVNKSANTPCASLGTAVWNNFMTVAAAAAANPGQGDQACASVTNLNILPTPIVYTINVTNAAPPANRNLNGFTVTDNLTGNLAFLFGVPITCNAPNPLCTGFRAYVPSTILGGENFPAFPPGGPYSCGGGDWCYFMKGSVSGPIASTCAGGPNCWLWADFNSGTRALTIRCIDNPPSSYSCDLPAGDQMSIALNSDLVYNYTYVANPPRAIPNPAFLDYAVNQVTYGGINVTINPGTSDRPGTSAVNMNNFVTVSAPDTASVVTSNTATSQAFLQCPQPLPGVIFTNLPGTVYSNSTVSVTVDLVNWYLDHTQGLTSQQGDPALGMAMAGAKITAPVDGTFANPTIVSTSPGSAANIDASSTATQININLTSLDPTPTAGVPFTDVVMKFDLIFGVIPSSTPIETTSGYITTFDTSFPSCGYPASGGIAPIATNSSNSEDPGDPGIVGGNQSSASSAVGTLPPSE